MSALEFRERAGRARAGLKGPRAAQWLSEQGIALPPLPNTWAESPPLWVARLGAAEFFLEDGGATARRIAATAQSALPGIYPVLREDAAYLLSGEGAHDVLAQICNVNFAALDPAARPVIMTMMIGVSVLMVPRIESGELQHLIWCDPTFGSYLHRSVAAVVMECGGNVAGEWT